jgi:hypothetical protein
MLKLGKMASILYQKTLRFITFANYRSNFYTSLALATVINDPNLLRRYTTKICFVSLDEWQIKQSDPSEKDLYIPCLYNYPENRTNRDFLGSLESNLAMRNNTLRFFLDAATRSFMSDIRESLLSLKKNSKYKSILESEIVIFQAGIRNALVHNYKFEMHPKYVDKLKKHGGEVKGVNTLLMLR